MFRTSPNLIFGLSIGIGYRLMSIVKDFLSDVYRLMSIGIGYPLIQS